MNERRMKILLVEDELACAMLLKEFLKEGIAARFDCTHVQNLNDGLGRLKQEAFDVVLLDLGLPDSLGWETYITLRGQDPSVAIIVLTGNDDDKLALQAVREGAQDYLVKGQFDAQGLGRAVRYAIERKRAEVAMRQSEEFFRLISENVTDLIAVLDQDGRRLYNSPSYQKLLGEPGLLLGSDSFAEIHPEDRARIKKLFSDTFASGEGRRAEYRMVLKDGSVRNIESQGSVIRDLSGRPCKVVVVSRDITERKEAVQTLRQALSDLKVSHEELKTTQAKLLQAEKLEAVSTFAAGVAHEVKNPLQTIILGVDYLSHHIQPQDATAVMVLEDIAAAVHRADAIIRGLMEFSADRKREVKEESLNTVIEEALQAVQLELTNQPIRLVKEFQKDLPLLRLDARTMKHVFMNLILYSIRNRPASGKLIIRTFQRVWSETSCPSSGLHVFKTGDAVTGAELEETDWEIEPARGGEAAGSSAQNTAGKVNGLGLAVLKKIIELYGGMIEVITPSTGGNKYTILFRPQTNEGIV